MTRRRKRHTPEQIIGKLREADAMLSAGQSLGQVVQALEVSEATLHRWRNQYGGDEGPGGQALEGAGRGEQAPEEAVGRGGAGQGGPQGGGEGKLLSPARKRRAVRHVEQSRDVSQRRACRVVGQPRSTQRYRPREASQEQKRLVGRMHELVRRYPRYGYRRMHVLLLREGWRANRKRVYRLWRREGFKVPQKQRKRRHLGSGENACHRRRAEHKDHVWCWDFIFDRTARGRSLKWFSVVDEYTRECLALEVDVSIPSERVLDVLTGLFVGRGVPGHIRSDNGPEFIAGAIRRHLGRTGSQALYIEPGAPWENGYAESFFSRLRDELLNGQELEDLREARWFAKTWRQEYNQERPHSALGYRTPAEFSAGCAASSFAPLRSPQPSPDPVTTLIATGT